MTLSDACSEVLSLGLLQHEYGIPSLWPRTAPLVQRPDLETEYYLLNKELAHAVNRLVFLNTIGELLQASAQVISELFAEAFESGHLQNMSFAEREQHLRGMTLFKTTDLTTDFLTVALPILRSIYQENLLLTDAEFTILNNLKKLYSHYNEHPANVRRLLAEYNAQKLVVLEEVEAQKEIQELLLAELVPNLAELDTLNNKYVALQNTYENKLQARGSDALLPAVKKLKLASLTLSRRLQRLGTLCDLLPNLVLCQALNWYTDKSLLAVVDECQDTAEKLELIPSTRDMKLVDELLKTDLRDLVL